MTSYDAFFSRAAEAMRHSPIRQMGTVAAQRADIVSFAPGYPGPDSFAWEEYRAIADRVLASRDRDLLQYGPTRGYAPLLEALRPLLAARARRRGPDVVVLAFEERLQPVEHGQLVVDRQHPCLPTCCHYRLLQERTVVFSDITPAIAYCFNTGVKKPYRSVPNRAVCAIPPVSRNFSRGVDPARCPGLAHR